jgi:hypothetical protein
VGKIARAEPLTLGQTAQRVQEIRGEALPCRIETLLQKGDGKPAVILPDNASIHHSIDAALAALPGGYGSNFHINSL